MKKEVIYNNYVPHDYFGNHVCAGKGEWVARYNEIYVYLCTGCRGVFYEINSHQVPADQIPVKLITKNHFPNPNHWQAYESISVNIRRLQMDYSKRKELEEKLYLKLEEIGKKQAMEVQSFIAKNGIDKFDVDIYCNIFLKYKPMYDSAIKEFK